MHEVEWKVDMQQALEWADFLLSRSRKPNTVRTELLILHRLLCALDLDGRPTKAEEITTDDIVFLYETRPTKAEVTKDELRVLSRFCMHYTGKDVAKQACLLWNREERNRTFIEPEEFSILYRNADPTDRMILVLGAFMGARRDEMANIRDCDIDDRKRTLTLHRKGHTAEGYVVTKDMPPEVIRELDCYRSWKRAQEFEREDDYLIQSHHNRSRRIHKLSKTTIYKRTVKLGRDHNIEVTPHSLRRLYATVLYHFLHVDLTTVRDLMDHADASTTLECYVRAYKKKEREATEQFSDFMGKMLE